MNATTRLPLSPAAAVWPKEISPAYYIFVYKHDILRRNRDKYSNLRTKIQITDRLIKRQIGNAYHSSDQELSNCKREIHYRDKLVAKLKKTPKKRRRLHRDALNKVYVTSKLAISNSPEAEEMAVEKAIKSRIATTEDSERKLREKQQELLRLKKEQAAELANSTKPSAPPRKCQKKPSFFKQFQELVRKVIHYRPLRRNPKRASSKTQATKATKTGPKTTSRSNSSAKGSKVQPPAENLPESKNSASVKKPFWYLKTSD